MKQKKRHKMMFGLWLGFMGLAGAMALLFWMVLHLIYSGLLDSFSTKIYVEKFLLICLLCIVKFEKNRYKIII